MRARSWIEGSASGVIPTTLDGKSPAGDPSPRGKRADQRTLRDVQRGPAGATLGGAWKVGAATIQLRCVRAGRHSAIGGRIHILEAIIRNAQDYAARAAPILTRVLCVLTMTCDDDRVMTFTGSDAARWAR